MLAMPRKMPPYVQTERDRHGRIRFYFRRRGGRRIALPNPDDQPAFDAAYAQALTDLPAEKKKRRGTAGPNSLEWLLARYRESTAYRSLSPATRRQRDNIFVHVLKTAGSKPFRKITRKTIVQGRERRAATPDAARNFLDAMRGLFRWALEAELIATDPTAGVHNPRRPRTEGFVPWTMEDVARYEKRWGEGTRERVWLHVLLYTGLRRGDAVTVGRQHVRAGIITLKTEKTGTEVTIPVLPPLEATLKKGPTGDLAFIVGAGGKPLTKESFGNLFREACNKAGITGKAAHGLRKLAAVIAAEAGATVGELEARFGWKGGTMASLYTRSADRKRLALQASEKIRNAIVPNPNGTVPNLEKRQRKP